MKDNIDIYILKLQATIFNCNDTIGAIISLRKNEMVFKNHLIKDTTEQALEDYLVLKVHSLLDRTKGVISLRNLIQDNPSLSIEKQKIFLKDFKKIDVSYNNLLERIKNNRHKVIAHLQNKKEMGMRKEYGIEENYSYLRKNDLPLKKISNLIDDIKSTLRRCATPFSEYHK